MFIVKCDRCGKEEVVEDIASQLRIGMVTTLPRYSIWENYTGGTRLIFLCKECEDALQKFIAQED